MAKILGIGGVFFRGRDDKLLRDWYDVNLGISSQSQGSVAFPWRRHDDPETAEMTIWSIFTRDSDYFGDAKPAFMINYIVDNLDEMLATLRERGAAVDPKVEESEYGRFGWVTDPEGNRVELWEPPSKTDAKV